MFPYKGHLILRDKDRTWAVNGPNMLLKAAGLKTETEARHFVDKEVDLASKKK